jgi:hypothetical protein
MTTISHGSHAKELLASGSPTFGYRHGSRPFYELECIVVFHIVSYGRLILD